MTKPKTIALVACTSRKHEHPTTVARMYASPLFDGASYYGRNRCDEWYVLSAKHGLLKPTQTIQPYDESLIGASASQRKQWAHEVFAKLEPEVADGDRVVFLAGKPYREYLEPLLTQRGNACAAPLSALGIGSQVAWLQKINNEKKRVADLDRLYTILDRLKHGLGGAPNLAACNGKDINWPERGVYIFFEPAEFRMTSPFQLRVTRIGTHSVSEGSRTTLWHRLRTHRGSTADRLGNHRGSIFRLHVGEALSRKNSWGERYKNWGVGQSATKEIRTTEAELEVAVSQAIGEMLILWISVNDDAGPNSDRAYLERNMIGLLSGPTGPIDLPTSSWLGLLSAKEAVRTSGLWNINWVDHLYDPKFLDVLDKYVEITLGKAKQSGRSIAPKNWRKTTKNLSRAKQLRLI